MKKKTLMFPFMGEGTSAIFFMTRIETDGI